MSVTNLVIDCHELTGTCFIQKMYASQQVPVHELLNNNTEFNKI
jgi:hypothetical protein